MRFFSRDKSKKLLAKARKAYQKGDRRDGARLIDQVLKKDFQNSGAWELLYSLYGAGQTYPDFQRAFTEKYYPESLSLLNGDKNAGQTSRQAADKSDPGSKNGRGKPSTPTASRSSLLQSASTNGREAGAPTNTPSSQPPITTTGGLIAPSPTTMVASTAVIPSLTTTITPPGDNHKIRVLVVDDIAQTRETIIRSLRFHKQIDVIAIAESGAQAIAVARETYPDVILMDVNMPDMDGINATANIRSLLPATQIIILTVQDDVDYMRRAMMVGARDFLTKPPMIDELLSAVQRAGEIAHREKAKLPQELATQTQELVARTGKIISVYSPKGGVGCTLISANLAASLYNEETPVVLVDGNLQFGDVSVCFNEMGKNTLLDLAPRANELDPEIVEEVLIAHKSGIKLLGAPRPEQADKITGEQFGTLLKYLRDLYSYVIVDTSHTLTDATLAALDASDLVVLITTQEIPAIADTRKFLELAPLINLDKQRILAVMNQYDKRLKINPERVSQILQYQISAVIPLDQPVAIPSINRGLPFMLQREFRSKPIGRAILDMAEATRQRTSVHQPYIQ